MKETKKKLMTWKKLYFFALAISFHFISEYFFHLRVLLVNVNGKGKNRHQCRDICVCVYVCMRKEGQFSQWQIKLDFRLEGLFQKMMMTVRPIFLHKGKSEQASESDEEKKRWYFFCSFFLCRDGRVHEKSIHTQASAICTIWI